MKRYLLLIIIFIQSLNLFCQRNELGVLLGGTYYLGDITPGKQFMQIHPALGFIYRYNFNPRFAYKLDLIYGTVSAADSISKVNLQRNLSFKSTVFEISNEIELNFIEFIPGNMNYHFTPYIFGGFTVFYFDPKAEFNGKWYALQPLGTEGQGTPYGTNKYSHTSVAFPFGIGAKYNLSRYVCIGLEWGLRKTYTDYLDDVSTSYPDAAILASQNGKVAAALSNRSKPVNGKVPDLSGMQRGNSQNNDWYSFVGLVVTFKIKNPKTTCPIYPQKNYKHSKFSELMNNLFGKD